MSQTTLPPEKVDDLLSDYFKSKMRQPWPTAPATASIEPSTRRTATQSNRARYTLAASVAILLGACWYFSNGSRPERVSPQTPGTPGILNDGSAKMPKEFEKTKKANGPTGPMLN